MKDERIGQWAVRIRVLQSGARSHLTDWHFIQSRINDSYVMKCGKILPPFIPSARDSFLEFSDVMPLTRMIGQPQLCQGGCE